MALTKIPSNLDSVTATTQSASDNSTNVATTAYVTTAISNLSDSAPSALNTLNELAAALNDDENFSTTVTNSIATKAPLAGPTFTGDVDIDGSDDLRLRFLNGSTFKGGIQVPTSTGDMISGSAVDDLAIRSQANILLSTGGNTEKVRINTSGEVGIGMNPSGYGKLSVNSTGVILALRASSGAGKLGFYEGGSGRFYFQTNNGSNGIKFVDGDSSTNRFVINSSGHITPGSDNTQDFGSNSVRWRNIYSADLQLSNVDTGGNDVDGSEGSWTIQEGENDLFIINRLNGKKYKFNLEEVE